MMKNFSFAMTAIILIGALGFSQNSQAMNEIPVKAQSIKSYDMASYNFGRVLVGSTSRVTFTIRNTGDAPLNFRSATVYGADYSAYHSCSAGLLPGQVCTVDITFWPMFEGMRTGRFYLDFVEDSVIIDLWGDAYRM